MRVRIGWPIRTLAYVPDYLIFVGNEIISDYKHQYRKSMTQPTHPIGQEINAFGQVINNKELMLVHLRLKSGEQVPPHDHKGQEVFFTVVAGTVEVTLDETETYRLSTGTVLHFPGEARVGVKAVEESEFFVYLINRQ